MKILTEYLPETNSGYRLFGRLGGCQTGEKLDDHHFILPQGSPEESPNRCKLTHQPTKKALVPRRTHSRTLSSSLPHSSKHTRWGTGSDRPSRLTWPHNHSHDRSMPIVNATAVGKRPSLKFPHNWASDPDWKIPFLFSYTKLSQPFHSPATSATLYLHILTTILENQRRVSHDNHFMTLTFPSS